MSVATRPSWASMPKPLRRGVEQLLGSPIVRASSQAAGFSPGSADRVVTAAGRRAFVKATGPDLNERSADIHRREAAIASALPASEHLPVLIGWLDVDGWVALVSEDIDGTPPVLPWRPDDLAAVLDACRSISALRPAVELPRFADQFAGVAEWWERLRGSADVPAWAAERIDGLRALAGQVDLRGDALMHGDLRADNVLIRPDGTAVIVDWPWACTAPAWVDPVTLLYNIRLYDPDADLAPVLAHPGLRDAREHDVDGLLALLCGFFLTLSMEPAERGVETVRQFQRDQALAIIGILQQRIA